MKLRKNDYVTTKPAEEFAIHSSKWSPRDRKIVEVKELDLVPPLANTKNKITVDDILKRMDAFAADSPENAYVLYFFNESSYQVETFYVAYGAKFDREAYVKEQIRMTDPAHFKRKYDDKKKNTRK